MKRALSLAMLAMFSIAIVGCHASADVGDDSKSSSTYKKTTTYDNGTKTTKTQTTVNP